MTFVANYAESILILPLCSSVGIDYTGTWVTLHFLEGAIIGTRRTVEIIIIDDDLLEKSESIYVSGGINSTNCSATAVTFAPSSTEIVILDDDSMLIHYNAIGYLLCLSVIV